MEKATCDICGEPCRKQFIDGEACSTSFCDDPDGVCNRAWYWRRETARMMLNFAAVPESFVDSKPNISNLDPKFIREPMPYQNLSMRIHGPIGTGKTYNAIAHAWAWVLQRATYGNREVIFGKQSTSTMKFIYPREFHDRCIRQNNSEFRDGEDLTEKQIMELHKNTGLLIIDDLFAEKDTEASLARILSVVNYRVTANLATIITTNLTMNEINAKDPRLASRIYGWENVQMTGADRRIATS